MWMAERVAVVLFNLGGPNSLPAVEPFLFNLFNDEAILGLPKILRRPLARLIARRRAATTTAIYGQLGGVSPLLANTREQATALQERLTQRRDHAAVFVCMRYWHPFSEAVVREVRSFAPDRVVLLPLYPQYSTTTTASSLADWRRAASGIGLTVPTHAICCYPSSPGLVEAVTRLTCETLERTGRIVPLRLLFSAHGLPKRVVARGDPYQSQVELTVTKVVEALGDMARDHVVCYQSRVGPLEWIGPSTEDELARAATDRVGAVVIPVAFVSEHSETLFELDIDYRAKAAQLGLPAYARVPTVGTAREFIGGLAELVEAAIANPETVSPQSGARLCAPAFVGCGCGVRLGGN